jgi:hypothetical protein
MACLAILQEAYDHATFLKDWLIEHEVDYLNLPAFNACLTKSLQLCFTQDGLGLEETLLICYNHGKDTKHTPIKLKLICL